MEAGDDGRAGGWMSMRDTVRLHILREIVRKSHSGAPSDSSASDKYMVLVLDHRGTRVMNAVLRMYDITEEGLAIVESLEKKRQPFPELEAIYFVQPTEESVSLISQDFKSSKTALYSAVHLFFTRRVSNEILAKIRQNAVLKSRIKTLVDANIDFLAIETNTFHLDMGDAMVDLYNETGINKKECIKSIVGCLVTLCATLHEYPFIRFRADSEITQQLANDFQTEFNGFVNSNGSFWWRGDGQKDHGSDENRGTLFMLDRSEDPMIPLLHCFTYQAMIYDMMDAVDDVLRYWSTDVGDSEPTAKRYLLSESDHLWLEFRHGHMGDVTTKIKTYIDELRESFPGVRNRDPNDVRSLEDLRLVMQQIPEYEELMVKHVEHLDIMQQCMSKLESLKLLRCAALEQIMVTGVDADAREVSTSKLTLELMNLVKDPVIGEVETTRLLALYVITQRGIKEDDRRRIMEAANPPLPLEAQKAIINLSFLGVTVNTGAKVQKPGVKKEMLKQAKELARNCDYSYSRYVPAVAKLIEQFCNQNLTTESFPYVIEPPPLPPSSSSSIHSKNGLSGGLDTTSSKILSVRRHGASSSTNDSANRFQTKSTGGNLDPRRNRQQFQGGRIIVFIAGGVTHAELQSLYDLMKQCNREIIIGATSIIKPADFLFSLKFLDRENLPAYFQEKQARLEQEKDRHDLVDKQLLGISGNEDGEIKHEEPATGGVAEDNNPTSEGKTKAKGKTNIFSKCPCYKAEAAGPDLIGEEVT